MKKITWLYSLLPFAFISTAYGQQQQAALINQSTQENPVYACFDKSSSSPNADGYNIIPGGEGWTSREKPGKIQYRLSYDASCSSSSTFSYIGIGNDGDGKGWAYTYSGKGKDSAFPAEVSTLEASNCS